jgi:hypothetical protein
MEKIFVAAIAFGVAAYASLKIAQGTSNSNRATEFPAMEKAEPLSTSEKDWTIVHIRDDLGAIHNLIILANGLLAGILGVLLLR